MLSRFALSASLVSLSLRAGLAQKLPEPLEPIPFIDDTSLGDAYPFAVHMPAGEDPPLNPPVHLFLHGMGSRGDASMMDTQILWNGVGRRIDEYYAGIREEAQTLAAEQFITIMPIAPMPEDEAESNWSVDGIMAVMAKFQQDYDGKYDPTRVYVSGYSMGARIVWYLLMQNATTFTAGALMAGELHAPYPDFTPMLGVPLRHYLGSKDFDGSSTVALGEETQAAVEATPGYQGNLEMVVVPGPKPEPAHNSMANVPFDEDLLNWFLSHKGTPSGGSVQSKEDDDESTTEESTSSSSEDDDGAALSANEDEDAGAAAHLPRAAASVVALVAAWTLVGSL